MFPFCALGTWLFMGAALLFDEDFVFPFSSCGLIIAKTLHNLTVERLILFISFYVCLCSKMFSNLLEMFTFVLDRFTFVLRSFDVVTFSLTLWCF